MYKEDWASIIHYNINESTDYRDLYSDPGNDLQFDEEKSKPYT